VPIVRYWIPHIRIISPEGLQVEMEQELAEYLKCPLIGDNPNYKMLIQGKTD
jgi:hypothetical protein